MMVVPCAAEFDFRFIQTKFGALLWKQVVRKTFFFPLMVLELKISSTDQWSNFHPWSMGL